MAEYLHRNEFLRQAQQLAVGQKRRIRHGMERTAAMDVYNNDDSWSAYCHRCHISGRVMKEHQRVRQAVVEPDRVSPVPATALHLSQTMEFEQRAIWSLLVQKGCPPGVIPEEEIWYDRTVRRILLKRPTVALGRALDENRTPKWLPYGAWRGHPMVWMTRNGAGAMVLAEDALSGYKVAKAIERYAPSSSACVVATLGTSLTERFLPYCLNRKVLCMYDGDKAGLDGFESIRQRLQVWGQPVLDLRPDRGDPKNMELADIFAKLEGNV
jgi:hypothetical protein